EVVLYGQDWNGAALQGTAGQVSGFVQYLAGSPFMTTLAQYGVGPGQVTGSVVIPDALGANVTPAQIEDALSRHIADGTLPPAGPERLYVVFTPPGVRVGNSPGQPADFLAYHSSLFDARGNQDAYAVVPYPGGVNPQVPGLDAFG